MCNSYTIFKYCNNIILCMSIDISELSIQERFRYYGLEVSAISETFGVSRQTLYRYFRLYSSDRDKIKKPIRDFFDFIMGPHRTDSEISDYLNKNVVKPVRQILPVDLPVMNFTSEYMESMDRFKILSPGTTLPDGSKIPEMPCDLEEKDIQSIMAFIDSRALINDITKQRIIDFFSDDNFHYSAQNHSFVSTFEPIRGQGPRYQYYELFSYLSLVYDILCEDSVTKCDIERISKLKDEVFEAILYIDYLRQNVDDFSNPKSVAKVINTMNRPTFDVHSSQSWYVLAFISLEGREESDLKGKLESEIVKAFSAEDARAVSKLFGFKMIFADSICFGPFGSKRDAEYVLNYLRMDWSIKFTEDNSDYKAQFSWLEELGRKQELRGEYW